MKNEYRIKEVPPILERENQTPIFYPQIKEEVVKTSGYLWWKKTETTQEWKYLYKGYKFIVFKYSTNFRHFRRCTSS